MPTLNTAWTHIVFVVELKTANINSKEHEFRTYVNGSLHTTFADKRYRLITDNYDFQIGRWTANEDSREYDRYLDDFWIYNRVLTQAEITSLHDIYYIPQRVEPYTINFPEDTVVQLLLVDDKRYIQTDEFLISDSTAFFEIGVGVPSFYEKPFSDMISTDTNSTSFFGEHASAITGQNR